MSYTCRDCSYSDRNRFPGGACPACGSFNVTAPAKAKVEAKPSLWTRARMFVLVALWATLLVAVADKLL